MNLASRITWALGLLAFLASLNLQTTQAQDTPKSDVAALNDPIEVLTRGPVHEAFAQPQDVVPDMGEIAPKQPPPPIPELPPEQKPEADNAQWIPGYWAWDAARQDFTWVSGVYRVPPQNRQYVPGYWANTDDGWRWVPGYWANPNQPEQQYTPEPPAPLDDGPALPPPDDNSTYIPGYWQYGNGNFAWQPGYWSPLQAGRFWVGPRYLWTPNGYLFTNGYWDLPYSSRGLLFAPVAFNRPLWNNPGWFFTPNYVVGFGSFLNSAFCRTGGSHFYFGNYYGNNYARLGYRPWYTGAGRYDPTFAYHRWNNNLGSNYIANTQRLYNERNLGRSATPPTTLAMQKNFNTNVKNGVQHTNVVTPINQFKSQQVKLVQANASQVAAQKAHAQQLRATSVNRNNLETKTAGNLSRPISTPSLLGKANTTNLQGGNVVRAGNLLQKGSAKIESPNLHNQGSVKNDGRNLHTPQIINHSPSITNQTPRLNNTATHNLTQPRIVQNTNPTIQQPRIINNVAQHNLVQPNHNVPHVNPAPRVMSQPIHTAPRVMSQPIHTVPRMSTPIHSAPSLGRNIGHVGGGAAHGGGGHRR